MTLSKDGLVLVENGPEEKGLTAEQVGRTITESLAFKPKGTHYGHEFFVVENRGDPDNLGTTLTSTNEIARMTLLSYKMSHKLSFQPTRLDASFFTLTCHISEVLPRSRLFTVCTRNPRQPMPRTKSTTQLPTDSTSPRFSDETTPSTSTSWPILPSFSTISVELIPRCQKIQRNSEDVS